MGNDTNGGGVAIESIPLLDFLRDYEAVCRKHGMIVSAYGWEITAYAVRMASGVAISEHIKDLSSEAVLPE